MTTSGWVSLGTDDFSAGRTAGVQLADNTGVRGQQLVVDAIAVTPASTSTPPPAPVETCTLVMIDGVEALNVRAAPNTDDAPIAVLDADDIVERTGSVAGQSVRGDATWYAISTAAGVDGYIAAAYARCLN